jgi:hypothetical protein
MLDVEYAIFDRQIHEQYGSVPAGTSPDSVLTEWRYDSLLVTLTPNRRPHWIGQNMTYSPGWSL